MVFWGILAIILFIVDALTSTALLIGFSISAIITSVLSIILPPRVQIMLFIIIGIILTIIAVPKLRKIPEIKSYGDSLEGLTLKASTDMIANELYQEKIKGTFWNVKCIDNVVKNQTIKIIKIDKENNCLIMKGE